MFAFAALGTAAAGLVQAVTGFGGGIVMMFFYPLFLPLLRASALSSMIALAMNAGILWRYRKSIRTEYLILPAAVSVITSLIALRFSEQIPSGVIIRVFGAFMILLSGWFLLFSRKISVRGGKVSAVLCAAVAGVTGALFGIGGPPMVLYYLTALEKKEEYQGTIQAYFLLTGLCTCAVRAVNGIYTVDLIPLTLAGMLIILAGQWIGGRIAARIDAKVLRKVIYVFIGLTG